MKILTLRFRNIHSLKGDHFIDFTQSPLADAGLFAITGPTGAGKSTILDIITLALFNKIPRFAARGTESISKTDIEKIGSVLTHFTDDAYAQLEYECHNRSYRSTWSISRARTGALRDYNMELCALVDEKPFDLKKSEVPAKNEQLLGLKYEQFIRSIVLSQGDFARFLKSDEKERAKLLEDITDSHIYREIGKKVFESAKVKEESLKILRSQVEMIALISDEDLQQKSEILKDNSLRLGSISSLLETHTKEILAIELKLQWLRKHEQTKADILRLDQKKAAFSPSNLQLKKHQELDAFRGDLSLWQNEKSRVTKLESDILQLETKAKMAANQLAQAQANMAEFTHSTVTEDTFMSVMKAFENKIIEQDTSLTALELSGKALRARTISLIEKIDGEISQSLKICKNVEDQYSTAKNRKEELDKMPTIFEGNQAELGQVIQQLQDQTLVLTAMLQDTKVKETFLAENDSLGKSIKDLEVQCEHRIAEKASAENRVVTLNADLENAKRQKEQWLKMASLDDLRHELIDGDPCPLCGSTSHPYTENLPTKIGENEIHIQQLTKLKSDQDKVISDLNTLIAITKSTIQSHTARISENQVKIQKIIQAYPGRQQSSDQIVEEVEQKKNQLAVFKNEARIRLEKEIMVEIVQVLEELQEVTKNYRHTKHTRMQWYAGKDINGDADKIQNAFVSAKEAYQILTINLNTTLKEKSEAVATGQKMHHDLTVHLGPLGYDRPDLALNHILSDDDLRKKLSEKEGLVREETQLTSYLAQIESELDKLKEVSTDDEVMLNMKTEVQTLNNEKISIHEASGAIQNELVNQQNLKSQYLSMMEDIMMMEKESTPLAHLNQLIGDATGNKYAKFAQNISLKHFIALANLRLTKLTDRYLLAESDIEEDLRIKDLYQGSTERSVKTLSGGETFIVSLAMALSLSDMASQNVRLDSLFIDEGFGTLDQETMDMALITLEKLQSEGNRTIGIISHVESLKERITTQIKVHKNNLGYSTIEVV